MCPDALCPELIFEDNHPTRAGYGVVAETVMARLAEFVDESP